MISMLTKFVIPATLGSQSSSMAIGRRCSKATTMHIERGTAIAQFRLTLHKWICFLNFLEQRPGRSARGLKVHVADKLAEQLPMSTASVSRQVLFKPVSACTHRAKQRQALQLE